MESRRQDWIGEGLKGEGNKEKREESTDEGEEKNNEEKSHGKERRAMIISNKYEEVSARVNGLNG